MTAAAPAANNGQCFAFGCPLSGSLGRGGEWACFCHYTADTRDFAEITTMLRHAKAIGSATLQIRRHYATPQWPSAYRVVRALLVEAGRLDLLLSEADCPAARPGKPSVRLWLARLECQLVHEAEEIGRRSKSTPLPKPTRGSVIGLEHALAHYREQDRGEQDEPDG